ncbi:MAG: radical SAM protein [Candidatus Bathyarchaeota archaeon]|nr:radical SAM protein [Candidatus Bathyarchaeota archaeon]
MLGTPASVTFLPKIISWNTTFKCNLNCSHCYLNAQEKAKTEELTTTQGKSLIDQIVKVSKPILILSGGEPLLRNDIFELASYAAQKGLRVTMGTNGTLIDDTVAKKLFDVGIRKVAISLDSSQPAVHNNLRGTQHAWQKAVEGIKACMRNGVGVQVNVTVTQQNYSDIDNVVSVSKGLGVRDFHVFFLVPTGRGKTISDISPAMYEGMVRGILKKYASSDLTVKPTCAPQFMRIARQMGLETNRWSRGCIAGLNYCRIYPNGEVTPCPYLPIALGNIKDQDFQEIWLQAPILKKMRNFENLKGKCHVCSYREVCGGCRARAYGLSSNYIDVCGGLHQPQALAGDFLAEEPWCIYQPTKEGT